MSSEWSAILSYIIKLAPYTVQATETLVGDMQSGASKKQMATDMLAPVTQGALAVTSGQNQAMAQIASAVTSIAIDQSVAIAKANGTYQKATAIANVVGTAVQVLQQITPPPQIAHPTPTTVTPQPPAV